MVRGSKKRPFKVIIPKKENIKTTNIIELDLPDLKDNNGNLAK
jgi:hypothetical protein